MTFMGWKRSDGRVGIRNHVLVLPASVCASDVAEQIASHVQGQLRFITKTAARKFRAISSSPWMLWQDMRRIPMFGGRS